MDGPTKDTAVEKRLEYLFSDTVPGVCLRNNVSVGDVQIILDMLRPKLDEAKNNLSSIGYPNVSSLLCIYDELGHIDYKGVEPISAWIIPHRSSSKKAWTGTFSKILCSEELNLNATEVEAIKKINYMIYLECVYSVVVNRLYYALAHTNSPANPDKLRLRLSFPRVVYDGKLAEKVKFIKSNMAPLPKGVPDITEACNINLRNMVAHGRLVGERPVTELHSLKDVTQITEPACVVHFDRTNSLESAEIIDLAAEYEKVRVATDVWNIALNIYRDITFGTWRSTPESRWSPPEFDLRSA